MNTGDEAPLDELTTFRAEVCGLEPTRVRFKSSLDGTFWLDASPEFMCAADPMFENPYYLMHLELEVSALIRRGADMLVEGGQLLALDKLNEGSPEELWWEWFASVSNPPG